METIDDLPLESTTTSDSSSRSFRLLLISVFADRLAFYGLRSIVIFYAVFELNVEQQNAIHFYGYYLLVSSVSSLIGGIISDFLIGPKRTMIVGLSLCTFGGILSLVPDTVNFVIGMAFVLIGIGCFRSGAFSYVGHITLHRKELLEKRFILLIGVINFGAFLSAIAIGLFGEYFGYFYALIAICVLFVIALVAASNLRAAEKITLPSKNEFKPTEIPAKSNIKFVVLASLGVAFFWFVFELYGASRDSSYINYSLTIFNFEVPKILVYTISAIFTLLLFTPYYFLANKISLSIKLALGLIILASLWMIWHTSFSTGSVTLGWMIVLVFAFFEGLLDLLVTPTILAFICRYSPKKYFGTLFGIYGVFCFAGIKFGTLISEKNDSFSALTAVSVVLIAVTAFFILVPRELKFAKSEPPEEKDVLL